MKFFTGLLSLLISLSVYAQNLEQSASNFEIANSDIELVKAVEARKQVRYLEAANLKVVKLHPDDTKGSPHQSFDVQLSNGKIVTLISNLEFCPNIPVRVNDIVAAGGEYKPVGNTAGIFHWVHRAPKQNRPDGYVTFNGQTYCK